MPRRAPTRSNAKQLVGHLPHSQTEETPTPRDGEAAKLEGEEMADGHLNLSLRP